LENSLTARTVKIGSSHLFSFCRSANLELLARPLGVDEQIDRLLRGAKQL